MTKNKLVPLARFMKNSLKGLMFRYIFLGLGILGMISPPQLMPLVFFYSMWFNVALYILLVPGNARWVLSGAIVATVIPLACIGNDDLFSLILFLTVAMLFGTQVLLSQALYEKEILTPKTLDRPLKLIIGFYISMPLFINNIRDGLTEYLTREYEV